MPGRLLRTSWLLLALVTLAAHAFPRIPQAYLAVRHATMALGRAEWQAFLTHWVFVSIGAGGVVLVLWACTSLGNSLFRWLGVNGGMRAPERIGGSVLAGIGLASTSALAFGEVGLLYRPLLSAILVVAALLLWKGIPRLPSRGPSLPWSGSERALLCMAIVAAFLVVPSGLAPLATNDILASGIAGPMYWTRLHKEVHAIRYHFLLPDLQEHFYCAAWPVSPRGVHIGEVIALLALAVVLARNLQGRLAGLLSLLGLFAASQTAFGISQVKHDLLAAAFALSGIAIWRSLGGLRGSSATAIGLALGWAMCTKYPACAIGLGIIAWEIVEAKRESRAGVWRFTFLVCLGGAFAFAPYALKNWLLEGNPLFPFMWGGLDWSTETLRHLVERAGCPGRNIVLSQPGTIVGALRIVLLEHAPAAWLALPMLAVVFGRAGRGTRPLLTAAVVGFIVAAVFSPCLRLMVPITTILTVCGAVALAECAVQDGKARVPETILICCGMAVGVLQSTAIADLEGLRNQFRIAAGLGIEAPGSYTARALTTALDARRRIEADPPRRLLLLGEPKAALFSRRCLVLSQDAADQPIMLKLARERPDARAIAKAFRQLGISMVVLNYVGSQWKGAATADVFHWDIPQLRKVRSFWARWAQLLPPQDRYDFANGGFAFYRIRKTPAAEEDASIPFVPGTEGLADELAGEGREGRKSRLEALVTGVPGVGHFQSTLGCLLVEFGDYRMAVSLLEASRKSGFEDAGTYGCMGLALRELHRYREAAKSFQRAAVLRPEEPAFKRQCDECLWADQDAEGTR